jgi:hypothetical protein
MKIRRRQISTAVLTAALIAVVIPVAFGIAPRALADDAAGSPTATASVVKVENQKAPRKKVVQRKFRPWAHPTPGQVREIINSEARRWGVSAAGLSRRVACESHYHWWATNGQYVGVLQMGANAFYRGLHTIRTYRVKVVRWKTRRVHDARVTHYSDGRVERRRTTPRRQRVRIVLSGRIPRRPSMANAFAQIRIGAQALRGISAVHSSEWSCGA